MMAVSSNRNYAILSTALVAPLSRGNVAINRTSTRGFPIINLDWLTNPAGIDLGLQAFKRQREIWDTPSMRMVRIGEEFSLGLNVSSDVDIERYMKESMLQLYHASYTCKIWMRNNSMAWRIVGRECMGARVEAC